MEFMITRTSTWSEYRPCDEAYEKDYMRKDVRTFKSFEEYDNKFTDNFLDSGSNHRINEYGYIEREFEDKAWFIEIDNLRDLLNLKNKYGDVILCESWESDDYMMIEIYDDYRE